MSNDADNGLFVVQENFVKSFINTWPNIFEFSPTSMLNRKNFPILKILKNIEVLALLQLFLKTFLFKSLPQKVFKKFENFRNFFKFLENFFVLFILKFSKNVCIKT